MAGIVVPSLEYAHLGGEPLFFDVAFTVSPGERRSSAATGRARPRCYASWPASWTPTPACSPWAVGRCTCPRMWAWPARASPCATCWSRPRPTLRAAGHRLLAAERAVAAGGDDGAGLDLATAIADWADLGATTSSSAGTRPHSGWSGPAWARWASAGGDTVGRRAQAAGAGRAARLGRRHPAARRARQLPRRPGPGLARARAAGQSQDRADDQPRLHAAGQRRHPHRDARGFGGVGARRLVRHLRRGERGASGCSATTSSGGTTRSGACSAT